MELSQDLSSVGFCISGVERLGSVTTVLKPHTYDDPRTKLCSQRRNCSSDSQG